MAITLTPLETKLLHLVLNGAAAPGEISIGAAKLVESLRNRLSRSSVSGPTTWKHS
jgi:hypothetical protein